jgi:hypothetical protein
MNLVQNEDGTMSITDSSDNVVSKYGVTFSPRCWHTGGVPATQTTDGNDTTPVVTETYIAEITIPKNATLTGIALLNGTVAAGNTCVALANSAGTVVASSASTAVSGTDTYQRIPFSATYKVVPGTYYVLAQFNNTSNRFNTHIIGNFGASKKTGEVFATFTTITPPTTFTTAQGTIASVY